MIFILNFVIKMKPGFNKYCLNVLFNKIPEIDSDLNPYRYILKEYEGSGLGCYLYYEDIFCPFVLELINKNQKTVHEKELIKRCFLLIEELSNHKSFEVRCVAKIGFLERLVAEIIPTKRIEEYVLPKSLELAREIGFERYGFNPITWEKE